MQSDFLQASCCLKYGVSVCVAPLFALSSQQSKQMRFLTDQNVLTFNLDNLKKHAAGNLMDELKKHASLHDFNEKRGKYALLFCSLISLKKGEFISNYFHRFSHNHNSTQLFLFHLDGQWNRTLQKINSSSILNVLPIEEVHSFPLDNHFRSDIKI